jgi:phenylacetate-CoA ligase
MSFFSEAQTGADLWELQRLLRNRWLSADELNALQERKLRAVVRHAYDNVAYYRDLFKSVGLTPHDVRTVDDLRRVPITTKAQLKAAGIGKITAKGTDLAACVVTCTSGSTGEPFATYRARRERTRRLIDFRALISVGFRPRDRLVILGPEWAPWNRLNHRLGLYRTTSVSRLLPIDEQIARIKKAQPTMMWAYPTLLRAVLHGLDYRLSAIARPRVLIHGAEVLDDVLKDRIRADLDLEMLNFYGAIEVGRIAHECRAHTGLHVNSDNVVLECLNGDSRAKASEPGIATVTSLTRYTMPIIRYHLGDLCTPLARSCPCGSSFPLIGPPQGRSWDMITLPSGKLVSPLALHVFLRSAEGIDQFRVIQESRDQLVVRLAAKKDLPAAWLAQLETHLRERLGEPMRLEIQRVDYMREDALKFKTFISKVSRDCDV